MKLSFKLQGLDCGNCASKLERKIAKVEGVASVSISFMTLKMAIDIDDSTCKHVLENVYSVVSKSMPSVIIKRC